MEADAGDSHRLPLSRITLGATCFRDGRFLLRAGPMAVPWRFSFWILCASAKSSDELFPSPLLTERGDLRGVMPSVPCVHLEGPVERHHRAIWTPKRLAEIGGRRGLQQ